MTNRYWCRPCRSAGNSVEAVMRRQVVGGFIAVCADHKGMAKEDLAAHLPEQPDAAQRAVRQAKARLAANSRHGNPAGNDGRDLRFALLAQRIIDERDGLSMEARTRLASLLAD